MKPQQNQMSQNVIVKAAGIMFLFCFLVPTLNWALVLSKLISKESVSETAQNIIANELLFRFGLTIELVMSAGLVFLSMTLYSILKPVNEYLARLGLYLKLVEATLSAAIVLFSFIALNAGGDLIGIVLNHHASLYAVPMVFLGMDMVIFSYIFYKSRYIPRLISALGILSFVLIFIHSLLYLFVPETAALSINQIIFYGPSGIFEIIAGTWLIARGIKCRENNEK